ncbi:MAG TPA: DUF4936 family protein [Aquabacterium sp.]|jgi:hypothetical protein|uniref:DUF4936 family protein n=1 Tax=Aquabacterium sp. TaxID=1872578 RepID=UPI002E356042|nr:DUF4936 family protein [Aquabacterium sp.]HEX5373540.1 DUF4936 family protein [Aquabacterium sp.]
MLSLYIYYQVHPDHAAVLQGAVQDMQARLRSAMPGLAASLHVREDAGASALTWMEIYHFNGHADDRAWATFEGALAMQAAQLPEGLIGARQVERFRALPARTAH